MMGDVFLKQPHHKKNCSQGFVTLIVIASVRRTTISSPFLII